jgi:hypothetical protein
LQLCEDDFIFQRKLVSNIIELSYSERMILVLMENDKRDRRIEKKKSCRKKYIIY